MSWTVYIIPQIEADSTLVLARFPHVALPSPAHMVLQEGPQQAAGVVGYQQFLFLNQLNADAATTIVAFSLAL